VVTILTVEATNFLHRDSPNATNTVGVSQTPRESRKQKKKAKKKQKKKKKKKKKKEKTRIEEKRSKDSNC